MGPTKLNYYGIYDTIGYMLMLHLASHRAQCLGKSFSYFTAKSTSHKTANLSKMTLINSIWSKD